MKDQLSDVELLNELKSRFIKNQQLRDEQTVLLMQLKTVNERLLASELLKSNFLSNIRNEINNPLASVLELSKNLSRSGKDPETIQRSASLIFNEVFTLDFQLRNIFASAEIEAGECSLSVISVNTFSLINSVINSFLHQSNKKELTLHVNLNLPENGLFKTDPEKLHLIISNLLSNAIQFCNTKGTISITAEISDKQLRIVLGDNGIGIDELQQEKIFDRFKQLEEGSTKTYGGHGLGLSVTKAALEILKGDISLRSKKGKGSEFSIMIPELEMENENDDIISIDGNDFLFNNEGEMTF